MDDENIVETEVHETEIKEEKKEKKGIIFYENISLLSQ